MADNLNTSALHARIALCTDFSQQERMLILAALAAHKSSQEQREALDKQYADLYATGKTYKEVGAEFGVTGTMATLRINRYASARRKEIEQAFATAEISLGHVSLVNRGSSFELRDVWWDVWWGIKRDDTQPILPVPLPPFELSTLDSIRNFVQQAKQKELDWMRNTHVIKAVKIKSSNRRYPKPGHFFVDFREDDGCAIFSPDLSHAREFNSSDAAKTFWKNPSWGYGKKEKPPRITWLKVDIISIADAKKAGK